MLILFSQFQLHLFILFRDLRIQVEGAFGVIKEDMAFRRFLTRGKQKTETQFFLIAFSFNIQKNGNRRRAGRVELKLFN